MDESAVGILNVVVVLYIGIFVGWFCVRAKLLIPNDGDMKSTQFFVGRFALPMVIFKDVATASFAGLNLCVIMACTLAKVFVAISTWCVFYFCYAKGESQRLRVRISTLFAFFVTSSNDLLIGFPLFSALFPTPIAGFDVMAHLTVNAVLNVAFFVPVAVVILAIWTEGQNGAEVEQKTTKRPIWCNVCKDIITNPLIIAAAVGLVWSSFSNTPGKLPTTLDAILTLFTNAFNALALFMTGAAIGKVRIDIYSIFLSVNKVITCAIISVGLLKVSGAVKGSYAERRGLGRFTFFYGSIPTSSAPIVLALGSKVPNRVPECMATAILVSLVLAFPQMIQGDVFLHANSTETIEVVRRIQSYVNYSSLVGEFLVFVFLTFYVFVFLSFQQIYKENRCRRFAVADPKFWFLLYALYGVVQHAFYAVIAKHSCGNSRGFRFLERLFNAFDLLNYTFPLFLRILSLTNWSATPKRVVFWVIVLFAYIVCDVSLLPMVGLMPNCPPLVHGQRWHNTVNDGMIFICYMVLFVFKWVPTTVIRGTQDFGSPVATPRPVSPHPTPFEIENAESASTPSRSSNWLPTADITMNGIVVKLGFFHMLTLGIRLINTLTIETSNSVFTEFALLYAFQRSEGIVLFILFLDLREFQDAAQRFMGSAENASPRLDSSWGTIEQEPQLPTSFNVEVEGGT